MNLRFNKILPALFLMGSVVFSVSARADDGRYWLCKMKGNVRTLRMHRTTEAEAKDAQTKETTKETQAKEPQSRGAQIKDAQTKDMQARDAQTRDAQTREAASLGNATPHCQVEYTKEGRDQVIAKAQSQQFCQSKMDEIHEKLVQSGWTCRDISSSVVHEDEPDKP